jgi:hypothetical protein
VIVFTAACALAGFVILNVHPGTTLAIVGVALLGAALAGAVAFILRLGLGSQPEREREAQARDTFERTGNWPGD